MEKLRFAEIEDPHVELLPTGTTKQVGGTAGTGRQSQACAGMQYQQADEGEVIGSFMHVRRLPC